MSSGIAGGLQVPPGQERALGGSSAAKLEKVVLEGEEALLVPSHLSPWRSLNSSALGKRWQVCQVMALHAGTWAEADLRKAGLTVCPLSILVDSRLPPRT